ncbi:MAG: hypothetical protein ABIN96_02225, partial [Rubrivivax sp.]
QRHADLFLDTWPVNAHTTASDALWAGLPLVTMQGGAFAARVAASLLQAVGLPQCVTSDLAAYEALARSLASQPDRVAQLRADLASERETAPLFGTRRFARHFEQALQRMHDRRLAGFEPAGFDVADQGQQRGTAARTADPR